MICDFCKIVVISKIFDALSLESIVLLFSLSVALIQRLIYDEPNEQNVVEVTECDLLAWGHGRHHNFLSDRGDLPPEIQMPYHKII